MKSKSLLEMVLDRGELALLEVLAGIGISFASVAAFVVMTAVFPASRGLNARGTSMVT